MTSYGRSRIPHAIGGRDAPAVLSVIALLAVALAVESADRWASTKSGQFLTGENTTDAGGYHLIFSLALDGYADRRIHDQGNDGQKEQDLHVSSPYSDT